MHPKLITNDYFVLIRKLCKYRIHVNADSVSAQILQLLYHDDYLTMQQIVTKIVAPSPNYTKKIIQSLQSSGYISNDGLHYTRNYFLTQMGRWFAISSKLNISFLSLCLLSDVYNMVKDNTDTEFYLLSSFRRLFDSKYNENSSAIYSRQHIFRITQCLVNHRLVYRTRYNDVLKMSCETLVNLKQNYDCDLDKLHTWIYEVSSQCNSVFAKNYIISEKHRALLSLIK
jgi:hypothetical protein